MCSTAVSRSACYPISSFNHRSNDQFCHQAALRLSNRTDFRHPVPQTSQKRGLQTPPSDDMTTTYQPPIVGPYDNHVLPSYSSTLPHVRGSVPSMNEVSRPSQYPRYAQQQPQQQQAQLQQQQQQQQQPYTHATNLSQNPASGISQYSTTSKHSTRTSTPAAEGSMSSQNGSTSRRGSQALIHHSLHVPSCINPKGGNLADFAAQITCLFWFESMDTLRAAENHAIPYPAFKKWAYGVLSTTQVTQSGRSGSEYRLLTVALMLGNKFLDDNTYTNKTWAEVSGISVQEIHVMEVEFLSNMRYSLLATKDEWEDWLAKLSCFSEYYERALKQPTSPIAMSSPTSKALFSSPLPSPTRATQATSAVPALPASATPVYHGNVNASNGQAWPTSYQNPAMSPLTAKSHVNMMSKKRAHEEDPTEPPAKRMNVQPNAMPPARPPVVGEQPIRLPVPNLSLNTNTPTPGSVQYMTPTAYAPPSHVSLPPLVPGVRAMSSVYPASGPVPQAQLPLPSTTGSVMPQATLTPTIGMPVHPSMSYGTPSRRHSPGTLAAFGSSPLGDMYGSVSAVHTPISHTPISHSPSVYLQQRPSPYKPVRHVNTLLYPPPSASLHEYHMSAAAAPQMHYQPLGRRNDLRTGVVPEYMTLGYRSAQPVQQMMMPHGQQGHHLN
ncbi:Meiotically up-regulated gene 80 protein like [Verticillium longisporum]|nr:Meiotically up-regulated gene 80 protein like [Verticillium longisporum]